METLVFGPGDYSAAVGIPITTIGGAPEGYPGDHLNYVYSRLVVAARAAGIQAIDGPYARVRDEDGLRARARLARALGLDGKWTIHPGQIEIVNAVFTPAREEWERAEAMLAAYEQAGTEGRGAAMFEGEMIDEANRKMAARLAQRAARPATPDGRGGVRRGRQRRHHRIRAGHEGVAGEVQRVERPRPAAASPTPQASSTTTGM